MIFSRIVLGITSLVYLFVALASIFDASGIAQSVGIALPNNNAIIDFRATYGGLDLGLAIFFALCAVKSQYVPIGLVATLLCYSGFVLVRIQGIFAYGVDPDSLMYTLAGFELTSIAAAGLALYLETKNQKA